MEITHEVASSDYVVCLDKDDQDNNVASMAIGPLTTSTYFLRINVLPSDSVETGIFNFELSGSTLDVGPVRKSIAGEGLVPNADVKFAISTTSCTLGAAPDAIGSLTELQMVGAGTTSSAYAVDLDTAGLNSGPYYVSYCDETISHPNKKVDADAIVSTAYQSYKCSARCSHGCTGDHCEGCSSSYVDHALCTDLLTCKDAAVSSNANQYAFSEGVCHLEQNGDTPSDAEDWTTYDTVASATACNDASKFMCKGTITITEHAFTNVEYVVKPGSKTSMEILGSGMNQLFDRFMVIDCHG